MSKRRMIRIGNCTSRRRACPAIGPLAVALILAAVAQGADLDEQRLNERLDEPVRLRIDIRDQPFRAALTQIERATGLPILVDADTIELLPYGQRTVVEIRMQGITLRSGLQRVCSNLGLAFTVGPDGIRIHPGPALERLGRRMTPEEAELLQTLVRRPAREVLSGQRLPLVFRGFDGDAEPERILEEYLRNAGDQSAYDALESISAAGRLTWRLDDARILILTRQADFRERLSRRISLNLRERLIDLALVEVGQQIGVRISFDAGVQQRLAREELRITDLVLRNTEAGQALDLICSRAGLGYRVSDAGIFITTDLARPRAAQDPDADQDQRFVQALTDDPAARALAPPASGPDLLLPPAPTGLAPIPVPPSGQVEPLPLPRRIVAVLRVPIGTDGTTLDFLLYEDELPPEFAELKRIRLPLVIERVKTELSQDRE